MTANALQFNRFEMKSNENDKTVDLRGSGNPIIEYRESVFMPYVEITALDTNSIFVANKAKTFDEEKNVANKAPVEGISINDLNSNKEEKIIKKKNNTFNYVIKIADFYFKDTANLMIKRIKDETSINKVKIMNISNTSYRVYIGPYKDLNSLQKAFNDIRIINFENLELIKQ